MQRTRTARFSVGWAALIAAFFGLGLTAPAQAQIQPFLKARNPFMWDGVAGHTLLGAEVSTLSVSAPPSSTGSTAN